MMHISGTSEPLTQLMATGVLIFEGMRVGVLPEDFTIQVDERGSPVSTKLVLSTAYNVLPIWIRAANDQLLQARKASEAVRNGWSTNDQANRELLIAELEPSMQVFVACGIALDALYDQLRPFAKLSATELSSWKDNRPRARRRLQRWYVESTVSRLR